MDSLKASIEKNMTWIVIGLIAVVGYFSYEKWFANPKGKKW